MGLRRGSGDTRVRRLLTVIVTAALMVLLAPSGAAADPPGLVWSVSIDDRDLDSVTRNDPLLLGRSDSARVLLELDNRGSTELRVRRIRIEGRVIGMAFFSYTTRLDIVLPPGARTERRFDVDVSDLKGQATGLLPTSVIMISPERSTMAARDFAVDVQGSVASVYGIFGLIMVGITVVVLAGLLLSIWRRQLPVNRWHRAARFLPAGLGVGLVVTFTLSATRLLVPSAVWWLPLLLLFGGGAFMIGYLLPTGSDQPPTAPDAEAAEHDAERSVRSP